MHFDGYVGPLQSQLGPTYAQLGPNLAQLGPNVASAWLHSGLNLAHGVNLAPFWPQLGPTCLNLA
eukprot:7498934-Karenia_brevis.AAC.1